MKDNLRGNPSIHACMTLSQNTWTYQTVTHDVSPHVTREMLLVSSMDCTTWILIRPLILVEKIRDSLSTRSCLFCERLWWDKELISGLLNKPSKTILSWWVISSNELTGSTRCWAVPKCLRTLLIGTFCFFFFSLRNSLLKSVQAFSIHPVYRWYCSMHMCYCFTLKISQP